MLTNAIYFKSAITCVKRAKVSLADQVSLGQKQGCTNIQILLKPEIEPWDLCGNKVEILGH